MATRKTPARAAAPEVLPSDVRLMNGVAALLLVVALVALAWQAVKWATRSPVFTLRAVQLDAALDKTSLAGVRAVALPRLSGNFFSMDLDAARAAFEAVPWVRRAVVRRVWPNRLAVTLEEHEAAALWQGDGRQPERLVNTHGELFTARGADVAGQPLPTLAGADGQSAQMLALLQRLGPALAPLDRKVETLRLSSRGSWRAELAGGARIEIGRGSDDELVARVERLARTLGTVNARFGPTPRALLAADLRHPDGYALRLAGISTASATSESTKP